MSGFAAVVDKPDVEESLDDVVILATGNALLGIATPFSTIKSVSVTVQDDGNGGVSAVVFDKAIGAPYVHVFDPSGTRVVGLVDVTVRGFV